MTGVGSARGDSEFGILAVEVRTVNGRSFGCKLRISPELSGSEADVEALLRKRVRRGTVTATLEVSPLGGGAGAIDALLAESVLDELRLLGRRLGLVESVSLATLLAIPGVVRSRDVQRARVSWALPQRARELVEAALEDLVVHRREEGAAAIQAMDGDLDRIEGELAGVQARWPVVVAEYRARLLARMNEFLATRAAALDPNDVLQEVAMFADKADVGEEIQRLATHLAKARTLLSGNGEVGRALEFLLQEILRETNTLGSKVPDTTIAHAVVEMKLAVERLKEQAQNLE